MTQFSQNIIETLLSTEECVRRLRAETEERPNRSSRLLFTGNITERRFVLKRNTETARPYRMSLVGRIEDAGRLRRISYEITTVSFIFGLMAAWFVFLMLLAGVLGAGLIAFAPYAHLHIGVYSVIHHAWIALVVVVVLTIAFGVGRVFAARELVEEDRHFFERFLRDELGHMEQYVPGNIREDSLYARFR